MPSFLVGLCLPHGRSSLLLGHVQGADREACPRRHLGLLTSPGDRLLQPGLLALSSGSVEERRADGFGSPVALDGSLAVAGLFGASGTPMAVLVDAEGRVASPLEAGADAVMALARGSSRAAA